MNVNCFSVYDCPAYNPETADGSSLIDVSWHRPVMSNLPKDLTFNAVDDSIGCIAQPCGTFCHHVQHRLDIGW